MKVELLVDPVDIKEKKADSRGRVSLGPEYADKKVLITVLDSEEPDEYEADHDGGVEVAALFDDVTNVEGFRRLLKAPEYEATIALLAMGAPEPNVKSEEERNRDEPDADAEPEKSGGTEDDRESNGESA